MFTGLIDDVGVVERVERTDAGRELRIRSRYTGLMDGESVAVNGACLTVRDSGTGWFSVAAIVTTLARTTIGDWATDRRVNLERAMRLGDRLGGHLVQAMWTTWESWRTCGATATPCSWMCACRPSSRR